MAESSDQLVQRLAALNQIQPQAPSLAARDVTVSPDVKAQVNAFCPQHGDDKSMKYSRTGSAECSQSPGANVNTGQQTTITFPCAIL